MAIQMGEARYRNGLRDSFEEGKAAGKMEGERQLLHKLIEIKYHEDCATWLQALTEEQMQIVSTLLLECDTFESLRKRLVRVFMNKYEEMQKDDELWSTAMAIQMGEARYRNGLRDSFDEGKAAGKMEGERQLLHRQMQIKFHEDCATWLQALTEEQMQIVSTLLLECDTFESLRKRLHKSDKK